MTQYYKVSANSAKMFHIYLFRMIWHLHMIVRADKKSAYDAFVVHSFSVWDKYIYIYFYLCLFEIFEKKKQSPCHVL